MSSMDPVAVPAPVPAELQLAVSPPPDLHLVVVTTVPLSPGAADPPVLLRTRFWHPVDQRYSENEFASLEHALRLFVDESGWTLRQDQGLDSPLSREWIFEARREDFTRQSREEILEEIGLTPDQVARALKSTKPRK
jgi:hypothetical protein